MQNFNWIDYAIFGIIGFSVIISFFRGFVREAISLTAWVLGLLVPLKYAMVFQVYLAPWVASESVRYFSVFVLLFLVIVFLGLLINVLVSFLMSKAGLSFTDRFIGLFFGALRGAAIVSIVLLMLNNLGTVADSLALRESKLAPKFKPIVLWLDGFLPNKMKTMTAWLETDAEVH